MEMSGAANLFSGPLLFYGATWVSQGSGYFLYDGSNGLRKMQILMMCKNILEH